MDNTITANTEIQDEYAWVFFGRNSEYYLQLWQLRQQGKFIHFSFAAFFLGLFWLAYRRMYLVVSLFILVVFVESLLEEAVTGKPREQAADVLASIIYASLFGLFGNTAYLWDAERKMRKVLRRNLPREEMLVALQRAGGTSLWVLPAFILVVGGVVGLYVWLGGAGPE
ncbi:DUF2628 domain-containing protein [Hymenobacter sp.]|jgi:uncharacterized membrane protein YcfT|uniref:DUF2628 domain-containing protein n=1 Tax=Hymenobacter sp. TaxID=1898978 RepID=UPI002ED77C2C